MTIASKTPFAQAIETGAIVPLDLPFRFLAGSIVAARVLTDGSNVELVENVDYVLAGGDTDDGGTLTPLAAAAAGTKLLATRITQRTQATDYVATDAFPAESHEAALDRLTMIAQEQDQEISLTVRVPRGETPPVMDSPTGQDGKALGLIGGRIGYFDNDPASAADSAEFARIDQTIAFAAKADAEAAASSAAIDAAATLGYRNETEGFRDEADTMLTDVASALAAGTVSDLVGSRIYTGKAALDADLVPNDGDYALVIGDATAANNDLYKKNGATGLGSWDGPLGFFEAASSAAQAAADAAAVSAAAAADSAAGPTGALDGYDLSLDEGAANYGPGVADGSTLAANVLRVIADVAKDSTFTQFEWWARTTGAGMWLVVLNQDPEGTWTYSHHVELATVGATGAQLEAIDLSAPEGSKVAVWGSGSRLAGAVVATETYTTTDPTAADGIAFATVNTQPSVLLTGTYSQVVDKGAVKSAVQAVPTGGRPGIFFVTNESIRIARAAMAGLRKGEGGFRFLLYGDSITAGSHTGTNGAAGSIGYTGARDRCYAAQLKDLLSGYYPDGLALGASYESFLGGNNVQGAYPDFNPRVSSVGDWAETGSLPDYTSIGGEVWTSAAPGGAALVYTTETAVDTAEIRYYKLAASDGIIRYRVDGGAWFEIDTATGANAYGVETVALPLAVHTIEIEHLSGGAVYFHGIIAYDSTNPSVRVLPCGFAGSTTVSWWDVNAHPWSPFNRARDEQADLKVIALGSNDINGGLDIPTAMDRMQKAIATMKGTSSVLVLGPPPLEVDAGDRTAARQAEFREGLFAVCQAENVAFIDQFGWFGDYATAYGRGLMDDYIHPSYAGATVQAAALREYFRVLA